MSAMEMLLLDLVNEIACAIRLVAVSFIRTLCPELAFIGANQVLRSVAEGSPQI